MHHLAVVAAPNEWPAHWVLPGFEVHHHEALGALRANARFDSLVLVEPWPEQLDAVVRELQDRERFGAVATLIAGRADSPGLQAALERHGFDGFLDLSWPASLVSAALRIAVDHVELGRNMVEIQRAVIDQARQQLVSFYEQAVHDGLTNLFNHRYFAQLMERQHERSARRGQTYALVFIDLDDLKLLNSRYGHAGGSLALNELARAIASSIRATDVAVRLGGDEFAVFLEGCDQAQGREFAQRLCARIREHRFAADGQLITITISCGVASYPEDGRLYSDLLKHADSALMHAKALGKDRAVGFGHTVQPRLAQ